MKPSAIVGAPQKLAPAEGQQYAWWRLIASVLGIGRDAGTVVNHARVMYQNSVAKKPNPINDMALIRMS